MLLTWNVFAEFPEIQWIELNIWQIWILNTIHGADKPSSSYSWSEYFATNQQYSTTFPVLSILLWHESQTHIQDHDSGGGGFIWKVFESEIVSVDETLLSIYITDSDNNDTLYPRHHSSHHSMDLNFDWETEIGIHTISDNVFVV